MSQGWPCRVMVDQLFGGLFHGWTGKKWELPAGLRFSTAVVVSSTGYPYPWSLFFAIRIFMLYKCYMLDVPHVMRNEQPHVICYGQMEMMQLTKEMPGRVDRAVLSQLVAFLTIGDGDPSVVLLRNPFACVGLQRSLTMAPLRVASCLLLLISNRCLFLLCSSHYYYAYIYEHVCVEWYTTARPITCLDLMMIRLLVNPDGWFD